MTICKDLLAQELKLLYPDVTDTELIEFIEKQKHKTAIVIHTLDRLQRGLCEKIKQLLKADKIEVHFIVTV